MLFLDLDRCIIPLGVFVANCADFLLALWAFTFWCIYPVEDALEAVNMLTGIQFGQQLLLRLLQTDRTSLLLFCLVHFSKRISTLSDLFTHSSALLPVLMTLTAAATFSDLTFFADFKLFFGIKVNVLSDFKFSSLLGLVFNLFFSRVFRYLINSTFFTTLINRNRSLWSRYL